MITYIQPILIALAVLLIPASVRYAVSKMGKKLDEGRVIAEANRAELKESTAEEAHKVSELLEVHRAEMLGKLDTIEAHTSTTNGKVAEVMVQIDAHDKALLVLKARTDVLMELQLKGKPE